jgi:hypothetical protein
MPFFPPCLVSRLFPFIIPIDLSSYICF